MVMVTRLRLVNRVRMVMVMLARMRVRLFFRSHTHHSVQVPVRKSQQGVQARRPQQGDPCEVHHQHEL